MEHEMKISSSTVRRLRTERGWSQEHLATASGLSLRTVQRVEAEGIASVSTSISLAATYEVRLIELQETQTTIARPKQGLGQSPLFLGLSVITVAILSEAIRAPNVPQSDAFAAISILAGIVGAALVIPALVRLFKQREYIGVALAVLGTPLVTLVVGAELSASLSGRELNWPLAGMGVAGVALVVMATRELRRRRQTAGA